MIGIFGGSTLSKANNDTERPNMCANPTSKINTTAWHTILGEKGGKVVDKIVVLLLILCFNKNDNHRAIRLEEEKDEHKVAETKHAHHTVGTMSRVKFKLFRSKTHRK